MVKNDSFLTPVKIPTEKIPESRGIFTLFWLARSGSLDKLSLTRNCQKDTAHRQRRCDLVSASAALTKGDSLTTVAHKPNIIVERVSLLTLSGSLN